MTDFSPFGHAVFTNFNKMSKQELFVAGTDNREIEAVYLAAFPAGTDPIYKNRTEHDCSCCKNFLRNIGNVVSITNGEVKTVWDVQGLQYPYDVVAAKMNEYILSLPITDLFRPTEKSYGNAKTHSFVDGKVKSWDHFHAKVLPAHICPNPATVSGDYRTKVQTFKRGLEELSPVAVETVLELITANTLYRGAEFSSYLRAFSNAQKKYLTLTPKEKEVFIWEKCNEGAGLRNSSIGTLLQDLTDGKDLEDAVKAYEVKVAPANYKRPTALTTPAMIKSALKTINELGYEPSLERRHANIRDITINNVLWADNSVKGKMKNGLADMLFAAAKTPVNAPQNVEDIDVNAFMSNVVPRATSMDIFMKNGHVGNLMSITAPVHEDAPKLFQWNNGFAWTYNGNITDSIKEKVKKAGGNVNALLRISLAWFNYDDLDIHVTPARGTKIYFGDKQGKLDVDMNAGSGTSREAVENVSFTGLPDGPYKVQVHQYCKREGIDVGFVIEVECNGEVRNFKYSRAVTGMIDVCDVMIKDRKIDKIVVHSGVTEGSASQQKWNLKTEDFVKVNSIMLSPNHWDDNNVGNKHWFFLIDGCLNDEPARGIYNEFLSGECSKHRKVFELIGEKTKCQPVPDQLSGLGFSSTKQDSVMVRVNFANGQKTYRVQF